MYYLYLLRCEGGMLYTGITNDWRRRYSEHRRGMRSKSKYTVSHPPLRLECVWETVDRSAASRWEVRIKSLKKAQKEAVIASPERLFSYFPAETMPPCHLLPPPYDE